MEVSRSTAIGQIMDQLKFSRQLLERPFNSLAPIDQLNVEAVISIIAPRLMGHGITLTLKDNALVITTSIGLGYLLYISVDNDRIHVTVTEYNFDEQGAPHEGRTLEREYSATEPIPIESQIAAVLVDETTDQMH